MFRVEGLEEKRQGERLYDKGEVEARREEKLENECFGKVEC